MKAGKEEKKQVAMVTKWNQDHKPGTEVIVTKDDQSKVQTKTRSEAYMLGASGLYPGHTAVVLLDGISGAYLLDRVKAV